MMAAGNLMTTIYCGEITENQRPACKSQLRMADECSLVLNSLIFHHGEDIRKVFLKNKPLNTKHSREWYMATAYRI